MTRPAPAEWPDDPHGNLDAAIKGYPHGTPLTLGGKLQAATRDATFVSSPDVRTDKATHIAVVSHRIAVGPGVTGLAAACDPTRIMLLEHTKDAERVHPNGRCGRPGCAQLFRTASQEAP